jgi:hypothetical protein
MILRFGVFLNPGSIAMITVERMLSVAVVTGFFTSMRACLNDRLTGNELSVSGAQISTWAGKIEQASSGALTCDSFVFFFSAMSTPTPHHATTASFLTPTSPPAVQEWV